MRHELLSDLFMLVLSFLTRLQTAEFNRWVAKLFEFQMWAVQQRGLRTTDVDTCFNLES